MCDEKKVFVVVVVVLVQVVVIVVVAVDPTVDVNVGKSNDCSAAAVVVGTPFSAR